MSENITAEIQAQMAELLRNMEEASELSRCVVVTRAGIKVAPDMDADTYSASSAALIDLGERVVSSLAHGVLQELVINALGGYVILVAVGKQHMLLGATAAALKMGYYLPFLRKKAWELENTIYGESVKEFEALDSGAFEAEGEDLEPEPADTGVIDVEDLKQADMAAMDDVLAAFDEFGVDDEFSASLSTENTPAVGISDDEMQGIREILKTEEEAMPDFSTTTMPAPVEQAPEMEEAAEAAGAAPECPIPLEPGEVAPYPLSIDELNPLGLQQEATAEEPAAQPTAEPTPAPEVAPQPQEPASEYQPPVEAAPAPQETQTPQFSPPTQETGPDSSGDPDFSEASEYDFDFEEVTKKDVVISEKDSMSDALKALGWEEE